MKESGKFILILKATEDKRLRYITARRLALLWPEIPFAKWKAKVDEGETIILMRSDNIVDFDRFKRQLDEVGAPTEIVEQKSIGGAAVF
ncbi:MAG TPA: hypothetical protein DCP92_11600 [Nitrospiraceae bacterium]|jgi:hypothetical protein|nr:hypothetical protein [Nitrospiraceae bacterium]